MFNKIALIIYMALLSLSVSAKDVSEVNINEDIILSGQQLKLNGAGVRTKFIFDIYVAAFYSTNTIKKMSDLNMLRPMRLAMHFVYDEVSKEKLVDGWNDGFEDNLSSEQFDKLKGEIKQFNELFITVRKGDVINLDYIPEKGTVVSINKSEKGTVGGEKFYKALLLIWLGEDPVGDDLKDALLGKVEDDDD
jgi:Chalcone isomerase-like